MSAVRCYAGSRYPERPLAFEWDGIWLDVSQMLRQERVPRGFVFHVIGADGRAYQLRWTEITDGWQIERAAPRGAGQAARVG